MPAPDTVYPLVCRRNKSQDARARLARSSPRLATTLTHAHTTQQTRTKALGLLYTRANPVGTPSSHNRVAHPPGRRVVCNRPHMRLRTLGPLTLASGPGKHAHSAPGPRALGSYPRWTPRQRWRPVPPVRHISSSARLSGARLCGTGDSAVTAFRAHSFRPARAGLLRRGLRSMQPLLACHLHEHLTLLALLQLLLAQRACPHHLPRAQRGRPS